METEQKKLARLKIFNETKSIKSQLPINIGSFEIAEFIIRCDTCHHRIEDDLVHGYATQPMPNMASFHAVSVCHHCKNIAEAVQRLKKTNKHTITIDKISKNGKWLQSEINLKESHWLVNWAKKLFVKLV